MPIKILSIDAIKNEMFDQRIAAAKFRNDAAERFK